MARSPIPIQLKIVAVLFILGGLFAATEVVMDLLQGHINIHFGVLGLLIGPGLIHLRPGWRTLALVFIWIAMIGLPLAGVFMLLVAGPIEFEIFGRSAGHGSPVLAFVFAFVLFAVAVWEYRVLTESEVRRLFGLNPVS